MAQFDRHTDNFVVHYIQGKYWTQTEDLELKRLVRQGKSLGEIAIKLMKKKFSVIMRLRVLSNLEKEYDEDLLPEKSVSQVYSMQQIYKERMQKWSDTDEMRLKSMYCNGANILELTKEFHRSPRGILMHLQEVFTQKDYIELFNKAAFCLGKTRIIHADIPKGDGKDENSAQKRDNDKVERRSYDEIREVVPSKNGKVTLLTKGNSEEYTVYLTQINGCSIKLEKNAITELIDKLNSAKYRMNSMEEIPAVNSDDKNKEIVSNRHGQRWDEEEIDRLKGYYNDGKGIIEIATLMGRSIVSIAYKLDSLGVVIEDDRYTIGGIKERTIVIKDEKLFDTIDNEFIDDVDISHDETETPDDEVEDDLVYLDKSKPLRERIIIYLEDCGCAMAKEIAEELEVSRSIINHMLYSEISDMVEKDDDNYWMLKG